MRVKSDVNFRPPAVGHDISTYLLRKFVRLKFPLEQERGSQEVYKRRESFLEMNVNSLVCSLNCIFYFSVKTFRLNAREFTKKK